MKTFDQKYDLHTSRTLRHGLPRDQTGARVDVYSLPDLLGVVDHVVVQVRQLRLERLVFVVGRRPEDGGVIHRFTQLTQSLTLLAIQGTHRSKVKGYLMCTSHVSRDTYNCDR